MQQDFGLDPKNVVTSAKIYLGSPRQIVKISKYFRNFAFGLALPIQDILKIRSVMLILFVENVGNFQDDARDSIVVLTHMRGSLLLHLHQRFPTTLNKDVA